MTRTHRLTAGALALFTAVGMLAGPVAARASENGRKNTALALGAVAAGLLLTQKNKLPGIVAAAGAAYAYSRYNDSVQDRHRWERDGYYNDRYDRYDSHYNYNDRNRNDHYDRYDRNDRNSNGRYDRNDRGSESHYDHRR